MTIAMKQEQDNVFRLDVHGMLRKADFDQCQSRLVDEIERWGRIRLLFVLDRFEGWEPKDRWNDLTFYAKHGSAIERIAIVGDERWRNETLMFAGADLREGPVEFFATDSIADARTWLTS